MWVTTVSRRQFIDFIEVGDRPTVSNAWETDSPPAPMEGDSLTLVWRDKPDSDRRSPPFPAVIVVDRHMRRDFLAWALTYFKGFRPFTAFCRVIDSSSADTIFRQPRAPSLGGLDDAALGLILGEAIAYSEGQRDARPLSVVGCASTCSFAVARTLGFGLLAHNHTAGEDIWRSWFEARAMTHQPALRLGPQELRTPWLVMLRLRENEPSILSPFVLKSHQLEFESSDEVADIASACLDLRNSGEVGRTSWERLTKGLPELNRARNFVKSSREDRVRSFEQALEVLLRTPARAISSFLAGCIVSQIGPGTMDHIRLLQEHVQRFPNALLWYGLCAGLDRRAILKNFAGGLGRRILREVLREESFLDQPRCDIAFSELEILAENEGGGLDIRSGHSGQLEVEIAPCVSTLVRWPGSRPDASAAKDAALFDEEWEYLATLLKEAQARVDALRKRLETSRGATGRVPDRSNVRRARRRDK